MTGERLLEIARSTGLREAMHGVSPHDARQLLLAFFKAAEEDVASIPPPFGIKPGMVVEHVPTRQVYRIMWIGRLRLPQGAWVPAVRYVKALESGGEEFYRPLSDFGNFILTTYGQTPT